MQIYLKSFDLDACLSFLKNMASSVTPGQPMCCKKNQTKPKNTKKGKNSHPGFFICPIQCHLGMKQGMRWSPSDVGPGSQACL